MVSFMDAPLTLREFMTQESLPLATIFREVLSFLMTREDAVVFGAHAVNAYCEPPRMTAEIDVMSTNASQLANDLRSLLSENGRAGHEKALSDRLDLHRLLRTFPELRAEDGAVPALLSAMAADTGALVAWRDVARQPLESDIDDE